MNVAYHSGEMRFGAPLKRKPDVDLGRFQLWSDKHGKIVGLTIKSFQQELEDFSKRIHTVKLEGIWQGIRVTPEDIREGREELLSKLEEKW